jgi:hypothetical protein
MYRTDTTRLRNVLAAYLPERPTPSVLRPQHFRYLHSYETIREGDIVEDLQAGDRARVAHDSFYGFLLGRSVDQAKQLPAVVDVLRPLV